MDIALLYRARLGDGASLRTQQEFLASLADAGARRAALGVSGFLLVADGYVYELLEGDFSAVSGVFGMVLAEGRLGDVEMLSNATINRRVCHQWSHGAVVDEEEVGADLAAKVQMLHHFATRFGSSQPVLRDFIAKIGQDMATPRCRLNRPAAARYALAS